MTTDDRRWRALLRPMMVALGCVGLYGAGPAPAEAPTRTGPVFVCAHVVLAVDGSESTESGAFDRQIRGLQSALLSARFHQAIQDCLPGSVAFAITTWSGADDQDLCRDWSIVTTAEDTARLAAALETCRYMGGTTDIGRALDHGLQTLARSPAASHYRTVFVLTNGRADRNAEATLAEARARAVAGGVTIAAYALLSASPARRHPFFIPDPVKLERYVAERVSAGPRAFTAYSRPGSDTEVMLGAMVELLRQETG